MSFQVTDQGSRISKVSLDDGSEQRQLLLIVTSVPGSNWIQEAHRSVSEHTHRLDDRRYRLVFQRSFASVQIRVVTAALRTTSKSVGKSVTFAIARRHSTSLLEELRSRQVTRKHREDENLKVHYGYGRGLEPLG